MLRDKISSSEAQMRLKLQEARITFAHSGDKGTVAEEAFRAFLRQYLPRRLEVGHGEVVDSYGKRSAQTDVVVANEDHPYTFTPDQPGVFFVEGVSAAGEVKSLLTTQHLKQALENSHQFKQLQMNPVGARAFAAPSDLKRFYKCPPWFLIAFESQLTLLNIGNTLVQFINQNALEPTGIMDAIFVIDRGWIINLGDGQGTFGMKSSQGVILSGWQWKEEKAVLYPLLGWLWAVMPRLEGYGVLLNYILPHFENTNRDPNTSR